MVLHLAVPRLALRGRGDARGKAAPPPAIVARHPLRRRRRRLLLRRAFAKRLFRRLLSRRLLSLLSRRLRERRSRRFCEIDRLRARDRRLRIPRASRVASARLLPAPRRVSLRLRRLRLVRRRGGHARPPPLERPRAGAGERVARRRPAGHLRPRRPRRRRRKQPPGFRDERERGDRLPQPRVVREHPAPGVGERRARPRARRQRRTRVERPGEVRPVANLRRENPSDEAWFSGGALNPYAPLSSSGADDPFFGGAAGASLGEEGVARVVAASDPLSRERFVIVGPHAREAPERGVRREPPPGLPGAHRPQRVPLVRDQAAPEARRRLARGVAEEAPSPRPAPGPRRRPRRTGMGRRFRTKEAFLAANEEVPVLRRRHLWYLRVAGVLDFGAPRSRGGSPSRAREDGAQRLIRDAAEGPRGGCLRGDGLARARAPRRRGEERTRTRTRRPGIRGDRRPRRGVARRSVPRGHRPAPRALGGRVVALPRTRERPPTRLTPRGSGARSPLPTESAAAGPGTTGNGRPGRGKSASRRSVARRTHPEEGARSGSASPRYGAADSRTPVRGMRSRAHTEATAPRALCAPAMNRRAAALWRFRGGLDVSSRNDERGRGSIEGGDPRRPSRVAALEAHLVDDRRAALDDGDEHGEVAGGALAARAPLDHLHLRGERGAQEGDVGTRSARRGVGRGGVGAAAVAARATVAPADVKDRAHEVVPRAHVPGRRRRPSRRRSQAPPALCGKRERSSTARQRATRYGGRRRYLAVARLLLGRLVGDTPPRAARRGDSRGDAPARVLPRRASSRGSDRSVAASRASRVSRSPSRPRP